MDARDSGLAISAVQLHHKVNQPLCLQAERARERQLLLSTNVSERFASQEAGRERAAFTKKKKKNTRRAQAEGGAVAEAHGDRSETSEGIKSLMFAL